MKQLLSILYRLYRQAIRNPRYRWLVMLGTFGYLISPIDLSPDLLPFLGQADDIFLVTLLATEMFRLWSDRLLHPETTETPASNSANSASTPNTQVIDVDAISLD
jgi:uncharacterized membrane protein YkvA (DUF1232 family)